MELINKTKTFIKRHKRGVFYVGCAVTGFIIGHKIGKHFNKEIEEAFKAGHRIDNLSYNSAAVKVIGIEKAAEIAKEKSDLELDLAEKLSKTKITHKQFNDMYEANVYGMKNLFDKKD